MGSRMITRPRPAAWPLALALAAAAGCGSDARKSPTPGKLKALGNFYLEYAASNRNKGPANEQAFKRHLRGAPDFVLKNAGLDPGAIDAAFVSDRDQEPFVILYGIQISQISGTSGPLIAYEKTGKNGKRLVGFANGKAELVDDARLEELKSARP